MVPIEMKKLTVGLALAGLSSLSLADAPAFQKFASDLNNVLTCNYTKTTPPDELGGTLYMCIAGKAETAKVFINKDEKTGKVENLKIMWNDWFKDRGYGVHPDKKEATGFINLLSKRFTPALTAQMLKAFEGKAPGTFSTDAWDVKYTYNRGPAIDERLFVFTPK
ncbi:CubicO group peptidase (beta-lactamase class C family) [Variovorax sp. W2I14]